MHFGNLLPGWTLWIVGVLTWCSHTALGQDEISSLEEQAIAAAVEKAAPSIVQIETIGGLERVGEQTVNTGPTTGVIVDREGHIFSSTVNFLQQPSAIFVRLADGKRLPAEKIAEDHSRKLVLLKIDSTQDLVPIEMVNQDDLRVGQTTIALGRTYSINAPNISVGILSAVGRIWNKAVQTDAKISPANFGGPLIDLQGKMIGILAPMSPDNAETLSGSEWYDSGIGFAIPMDPVMSQFESMSQGKDLKSGKLGITFSGSNIYADPAKIAYRSEASPAALAGLKAGDEIVEVDGQKIARQAQFRHAIGPLYAGEKTTLVVKRGDQRETVVVELAATIEPFRPPALGLIVERVSDSQGQANPSTNPLVVSKVVPESGAASAGIQKGDLILKLENRPVSDEKALRDFVLQQRIGDSVQITISRDQQIRVLEVTVSEQTAKPLTQDGSDDQADNADKTENAECKVLDIKVPEFSNRSFALVPADVKERQQNHLLVWVASPGAVKKEKWIADWKRQCAKNRTVLLVVQSVDESKWSSTESEFIFRAVELVKRQTTIDPRSISIAGNKAGGAMAALTAFQYREQFRGLILLNSVLPTRLNNPETSPQKSLMILMGHDNQFKDTEGFEAGADKLKSAHFPVHVDLTIGRSPTKKAATILNWMNSLNRL